jgi:hypothetical protein
MFKLYNYKVQDEVEASLEFLTNCELIPLSITQLAKYM